MRSSFALINDSIAMRGKIIILLILAVLGASWFVNHRVIHQRELDVELIKAAYEVDVDKVKSLIERGADPRARFESVDEEHFRGFMAADQFTAMLALAHSESQKDRIPVAEALLKAGADIDADDGYGTTSLGECCYMSREHLALYLIDKGANPNTKEGLYIDGTYDISPAHRATNNYKVLEELIAHGADLSVIDSAGYSVLDWAKRSGDPRVVDLVQGALNR